MICSIHMKWKKGEGGQSVDLTIGVQDVLGTSHTDIIQDFDKLYIGGISWDGFSSCPYH